VIGQAKFQVGQRVKPSRKGQLANVFPSRHWDASDTITEVDKFNTPSVRWDHSKTTVAPSVTSVSWHAASSRQRLGLTILANRLANQEATY
jgi:hypothetical protein